MYLKRVFFLVAVSLRRLIEKAMLGSLLRLGLLLLLLFGNLLVTKKKIKWNFYWF